MKRKITKLIFSTIITIVLSILFIPPEIADAQRPLTFCKGIYCNLGWSVCTGRCYDFACNSDICGGSNSSLCSLCISD